METAVTTTGVPITNTPVHDARPRKAVVKRKRGKQSHKNRMDKYREAQGSHFESDRRRKIEERKGGFSADVPLLNLYNVATTMEKLSVDVPLGTRSVGFAEANCYETLRSVFPQKVP